MAVVCCSTFLVSLRTTSRSQAKRHKKVNPVKFKLCALCKSAASEWPKWARSTAHKWPLLAEISHRHRSPASAMSAPRVETAPAGGHLPLQANSPIVCCKDRRPDGFSVSTQKPDLRSGSRPRQSRPTRPHLHGRWVCFVGARFMVCRGGRGQGSL